MASWTGAAKAQTCVAKIGTTGRGIGPAYEDKVGRRAIRVADLFDAATLDTADRAASDASQRLARGAGAGAGRSGGAEGAAGRDRAEAEALCRPGLEGAERGAAGGQADPVRRRAGRRFWTSTTGPIPLSPAPTPSPGRRRRARASGRRRSTSCWASSRPIRPAWAKARSRPSCTMPMASGWASGGMSSAP